MKSAEQVIDEYFAEINTDEYIIERLKAGLENSKFAKNEEMIEVFQASINAIEKQVPKKPIRKLHEADECSVCRERIFFRDRSPFCSNCGQKLDWSE